ncbi:hypothetical protein D3C72_1568070 [compost metagenome]
MTPGGTASPSRSSDESASGSTNCEFFSNPRWDAWRRKVSRSPPQAVDSTTSGRNACRRVTSLEKSGAPNLGNSSATILTSGFKACRVRRKISQESRPQA